MKIGNGTYYNEPFFDRLKSYRDDEFDLAIIDPPYGININHNIGRRKGDKPSNYKKADWDNEPPSEEEFAEIFRVSKNQIIFGANHFISRIPFDSPCWLIYDKMFSNEVSFAAVELAWTSFKFTSKRFRFSPSRIKNRIHPTQKPIELYYFILDKFGEEGQVVLDTHVGSASSLVACQNRDFRFVGFEKDEDHFAESSKRLRQAATLETVVNVDPIKKTLF